MSEVAVALLLAVFLAIVACGGGGPSPCTEQGDCPVPLICADCGGGERCCLLHLELPLGREEDGG